MITACSLSAAGARAQIEEQTPVEIDTLSEPVNSEDAEIKVGEPVAQNESPLAANILSTPPKLAELKPPPKPAPPPPVRVK